MSGYIGNMDYKLGSIKGSPNIIIIIFSYPVEFKTLKNWLKCGKIISAGTHLQCNSGNTINPYRRIEGYKKYTTFPFFLPSNSGGFYANLHLPSFRSA